jgi:PIN domain nuclease of toxin-antitoxin system
MNRYLLDTHFVLWWMRNDPELGSVAREIIASEDIAVSVVNLWELTLKSRKGKLALPDAPLAASLEAQGFNVLPLRGEHIEAGRGVNLFHQDPFDYLMVAVAQSEGRILLTRDQTLLAARLPHVQAA